MSNYYGPYDEKVINAALRVAEAAFRVTSEGHAHVFAWFSGHVAELTVDAHPVDHDYSAKPPADPIFKINITLDARYSTPDRVLAELAEAERWVLSLRAIPAARKSA